MTECEICGRTSIGENLCEYHMRALENVRLTFSIWKKTTGIEWKEYLSRVMTLDGCGTWVKEIIEYIMSQDDCEELQLPPGHPRDPDV